MATHPLRFGIQTGQQGVTWDEMLGLWQKADGWGYDSLWNFDHFYPIFVMFQPYFTDEMQAFAEEVMPAARRR